MRSSSTSRQQRGVVLLYTLIALVIMLLSAVAMVRSFNTSLFNAGNLAFKRDLFNQGERARQQVMPVLDAGGALGTEELRQEHMDSQHYSATILPSNLQGVPLALLNDNYTDAGGKRATGARDITSDNMPGVRVRYVIDRQCLNTGEAQLETCVLDMSPGGANSNTIKMELPEKPINVVYRLSIRVDGPRNTQAFMQANFTF